MSFVGEFLFRQLIIGGFRVVQVSIASFKLPKSKCLVRLMFSQSVKSSCPIIMHISVIVDQMAYFSFTIAH